MNYNEIYRVVKKYINQMDYYGLLAGGAPDNEFDIESKEISRRIGSDKSTNDIAKIIADVFNFRFGEKDDAEVFLSVSEKIKNELL